mmetsp:Transcript_42812/g.167295  ORF Transcript_42812/g.167295 Transcript_42812/m.167295 type:complete len:94 (+) Transcript_42812:171-452(+)
MPVTTPSLEAIRLYRDILRTCRAFTWTNEAGERWGVVLAKSARKEFEMNKFLSSPEQVARSLLVGRSALDQTQERVAKKRQDILAENASSIRK